MESLPCIILQGVFETNCGKLRQVWATYRQAITAAQLLGLHRTPMPRLKRIEPDLQVEPEMIWFRIVYMDRYLSLLLGLPQGTMDHNFCPSFAMYDFTDLGTLERRITAIASRILRRNESASDATEFEATRDIDFELLRTSQSVAPSFWRPVNFHSLVIGEADTFLETLRLGAQVYYFGLLIHLHLPQMLPRSGSIEHDYSKRTCVNASRESLTRFVGPRNFNPVSSCSRPVDFFALLASLTLLLAHLDAQQQRKPAHFLAHQRLSDRATLDGVLEIMDLMSDTNGDIVTKKGSVLIRQLLEIKADAARGNDYITVAFKSYHAPDEVKGSEYGISLEIPSFGSVVITPEGTITHNQSEGAASSRLRKAFPEPPQIGTGQTIIPEDTNPGNLSNPTWSIGQSEIYNSRSHMPQCPAFDLDESTASTDDWIFQGVDTAFFDSLMRVTPASES